MKKLVIATRGSKLALWQSEHIKSVLQERNPGLEVVLKIVVTSGDRILDVPLAKIGGKGLFLKEIEETMLRGEAHIAVHSLKDVPTEMPEGLKLAAITEREDVRDALLSEKYADIASLPEGAVVGTSSLRRRMQILALRPDLVIKDLRGNVDTRIRKLKEGEYDAIILASAGINRLGLLDSVEYVYPIAVSDMTPAMGQGALGIEAIDDPEVLAIARQLNDEFSAIETTIEREFVDTLQGGCQVPIGINATVLDNGNIVTKAIVGLPDGTEIVTETVEIGKESAVSLGRKMADDFIGRGAQELLKRAEAMAFKD